MYLHFHLAGEVSRISAHRLNVNEELTGPHSHAEAVRLEPNPAYVAVVPSTSGNDPQYEECSGGVTRGGNVVENPAYQPLNATFTAKTEEGPAYQNVRVASS